MLHGDSGKVKQVRQALQDLAEEGLVQVFRPLIGGHWIVGVVGVLQLDVLKSRIAGEYNADDRAGAGALPDGALGRVEGRQGGAGDASRRRTAAAWPRTATGGSFSSPATPGSSTTSPSAIPEIAFRDTCELAELKFSKRSAEL